MRKGERNPARRKEIKEKFLIALEKYGTAKEAIRECGAVTRTIYNYKNTDPVFRQKWDEINQKVSDRIVAKAKENGEKVNGQNEFRKFEGKQVCKHPSKNTEIVETVRQLFLEELGESYNVTQSAEVAGVSRSALYKHKRENAKFDEEWEFALNMGREKIHDVVVHRAVVGAEVPIICKGEITGTTNRPSDKLLMELNKENGKNKSGTDRINRKNEEESAKQMFIEFLDAAEKSVEKNKEAINKMNDATVKLLKMDKTERKKFIEDKTTEKQCNATMHNWRGFIARKEQIAPNEKWEIWMILAGRGFGKTRAGAEWVKEQIENGVKDIAIIGETANDVRQVMVSGPSGIMTIYPKGEKPIYEPSKRIITWENGAVARLYNATEPNQLRGPQHEIAWCDELAKWKYARDTWDQMQFGLRIGKNPKVVITTTPRPIKLIQDIVEGKEGEISITRGKTHDNQQNLADGFIKKIEKRYAATRLGKQELYGEILGDMPGALWTLDQINEGRIKNIPEDITRIVVAVDPAISDNEESNENGIVVVGVCQKNQGYVIEDASINGTPMMWAKTAINLYDKYQADGIVVETNQGGDMVAQTLRSVRDSINIIEVRASRGKHIRAEPIAALYEQKRIHHINEMEELENQMILMTTSGYKGEKSPDRLDALVWGMTTLFPEIITPEKFKSPIFKVRQVV